MMKFAFRAPAFKLAETSKPYVPFLSAGEIEFLYDLNHKHEFGLTFGAGGFAARGGYRDFNGVSAKILGGHSQDANVYATYHYFLREYDDRPYVRNIRPFLKLSAGYLYHYVAAITYYDDNYQVLNEFEAVSKSTIGSNVGMGVLFGSMFQIDLKYNLTPDYNYVSLVIGFPRIGPHHYWF
ncbi:MAG: hypothetical protein ABJF04_06285 [Reichenbachiella sp.]|uniref:hypothetical protein n=1 Tax=Reichenbachiella sp. TaxID=2184521 RepID=UPI00326367A2